MSETRFTKGPWMFKRHDGAGRVMEFKREFWEVGGGPDKAGVAFVFKGEGNATLIAAAPELYEALKQAKEFVEDLQLPDAEWSRVLDCIVAALAKAAPPEALGRPLPAAQAKRGEGAA